MKGNQSYEVIKISGAAKTHSRTKNVNNVTVIITQLKNCVN